MRLHSTNAFARALIGALAVGLPALLAQRPDLLILALPMIGYVLWELLRRPRGAIGVGEQPELLRVREGMAAPIETRIEAAERRLVVTVAAPERAGVAYEPKGGAILDAADADRPIVLVARAGRWGGHRVDPLSLNIATPLGGWAARVDVPGPLVVAAPIAEPLRGPAGVARPIGVVGNHTSARRGDGSAVAGVRPFTPGDRLRRINWRVTSRAGTLHVAQTQAEKDTDVLLVTDTLDDVAPMAPGAISSLDVTVRAVAALALHYTGLGDRVAVWDLGSKIRGVAPGSGRRQLQTIMTRLTRADRDVRSPARPRPVRALRPGTLVFFCSPLLSRRALAELGRLQRLGAELVVVDTLPEGYGSVADLRYIDPEYWRAEVAVLRRLGREADVSRLDQVGIPVVPWRGPASLAGVLLALEQTRARPQVTGGAR